MGISGLLPLLKSIQVSKHLSEFSGQTLAVDAYIWLHRGILSCATELATGKPTIKHVTYAMRCVHLIKNHGISPLLVFDGGPLPAKKGTEVERHRRRQENLQRANALAAQGKHTQAREYYVKCVDVTPQMAFQFIKALRAASILYIVAPYEADAQMAYLERIGLVDGIITEDSDLLVFGCHTVLFKLDMVANTVISVSRSDFASVTPSSSDSSCISLVGWSDVQFRSMAILSGCDYLPSIPGIGLKTAWSLLRKWRTVENVIREIKFEGKKNVPNGYMANFKLAEKCFLHQRVYDPVTERLVHLTAVNETLDPESEMYVGSDIEASLAKKVALGDVDPITLLPIEDINPQYIPNAKAVPLSFNVVNRPPRPSGSEQKTDRSGILSFFGPKPKIPPMPREDSPQCVHLKPRISAGLASGKRTLADVMDVDVSIKKRLKRPEKTQQMKSRFFDTVKVACIQGDGSNSAELSCTFQEKENDRKDGNDSHSLSVEVDGEFDEELGMDDVEEPKDLDQVTQEEGYISPSPLSSKQNTPELSSPPRPGDSHRGSGDRVGGDREVFDYGVDAISSPPLEAKQHSYFSTRSVHRPRFSPRVAHETYGQVLVLETPSKRAVGPDLRDFFDDSTSEIDCFDDDNNQDENKGCSLTSTPAPSPLTPTPTPTPTIHSINGRVQVGSVTEDVFDSSDRDEASAMRTAVVASGWRERWALGGNDSGEGTPLSRLPALRRRETTVTPFGRQYGAQRQSRLPSSHRPIQPAESSESLLKLGRVKGRQSLFLEPLKSGKSSITLPRVGISTSHGRN